MTRRTPWSLRARLVVGVVALLAVVATVIGVVSVAVLRDNLERRLDTQVEMTATRAGNGPGGLNDPTPDAQGFLPGAGEGAVRIDIVNGAIVRQGYIDATSTVRDLDRQQLIGILRTPFDGRAHTVNLGNLGDYRVVAHSLNGGRILFAGLSMADVEATTNELVVIVVVVALIALAIAVVLGLFVVGVALRPLTRVAATATRVSELRMEAGPVAVDERVPDEDAAPTTEVGRVGAALNRLLDRVQSALSARAASEDKLRRFVADASHELRTPLASIRGYAELSRRYDDELPPDVRRSLERIGSESVRMTALVEDLLLLARLDSGAELRREPVDLARLAVDAVGDAHVAAPDHRWVLEELDPVEVPGDQDRLHQVLANLLANARTHTPPGTEVSVRVLADADDAVLEVRDGGPGIPDAVRETLFERFVRADSSRSRASGSTGLGLSIARAIVDAHGGEISVDSRPGETVFRVRLPRDPYRPTVPPDDGDDAVEVDATSSEPTSTQPISSDREQAARP